MNWQDQIDKHHKGQTGFFKEMENKQKQVMETTEKLLEFFSQFSKDQQRDELEQLLLALQEKGGNLVGLLEFWEKGGIRQP
jgi:uncharacterized membrane protein YgaE (UPF0421/DUF939 family)